MLRHVVTDLYEVYLKEFEAQLGKTSTKPQLGAKKDSSGEASKSDSSDADSGDKNKKQARQLAYDTRYKARREGIPLERAWSQVLQNSSAPAPVKELAKGMVFGGVKKEEFTIEEEGKRKEKVLVTPVKGFGKPYRRYADLKKKYELRKNPQIQSVVGTSYGTPYEGEKKKGEQTASALQHKKPEKKAKKDYDGDGKVESGTDEWKGSRDKAIKKAIVKKNFKVKTNESYHDWRDDLREVLDVIDKQKNKDKISEKNVSNKIIINPDLKENLGAKIVEIEEINEDYLIESVDIATEYFFNQGLNEDGLDFVIEELGLEKFTDFVFYVAEDYELTEARRSGRIEPVSKSGKSIATLKGGAKASAIRAKQKEKAARDKSDDRPSGMTAALKSQSSIAKKVTTDKGKKAVEKAKATQGSKKPLKDRIAKGVLGAVKAYQQGMERHKAATATAGKALKVAAKGASEFGKGVASGVKATGKAAQTAHRVLKNSYEMDEAVYGGEKKKPEDKRMIVTAADKRGNTKAWQNYKSGHKGYKAADHLQSEAKKMKGEDPCWKGYQMVGTKKKGGKEVPNCVPEEVKNPYAIGMAAAMKSTGDKPPLEKSTITKAHKIAKKVKAQEAVEIVDEAISTVTGQQGSQVASKQQDTEQRQTKNAQAKLAKIIAARKNLQNVQQQAVKSGMTNIGSSFEVDGEMTEARGDWYSGKGTHRTTASGHRVRWDEPSIDREDEINNQIQAKLAAKRRAEAKARLAAKGNLPVKKNKESN